MRLSVTARSGSVNESVRRYAEQKLGKLGKRLHELTEVDVVLWQERNPSIADDHAVEGVIHTKGANLVARESATSYEAAIDRLLDKLERQVERYRDKRTHEVRRRASAASAAEPEGPTAEELERELLAPDEQP